jgi:hypothetical protein
MALARIDYEFCTTAQFVRQVYNLSATFRGDALVGAAMEHQQRRQMMQIAQVAGWNEAVEYYGRGDATIASAGYCDGPAE